MRQKRPAHRPEHIDYWGIIVIRYIQICLIFICAALLMGSASLPFAQADNQKKDCAYSDSTAPVANWLADIPQGQLKPLSTGYFLDRDGRIDAATISAQQFLFDSCQSVFVGPPSDGGLWLRFIVENPHRGAKQWGIAFMETIFDEVILFEETDHGLVMRSRDGRNIPAAQSDSNTLKTVTRFTIDAGQQKTYYLRVSGTYSPSVTPVLTSPNLFSNWSSLFALTSAILLGFSVIMTMCSVIVFRHIDARFYQYYALYLIALFFFTFLYDGWLGLLFGVTNPLSTMKPLIELSSGIGLLANIQYCRVLLTIDVDPRQRRQTIFTLLTGLGLLVTFLAVINPWDFSLPLPLLFFLSPLVLLFVAAKKARDGMKQAIPVCGSLLCLAMGLCFANYFFIFPVKIAQTSSAFQLILMRPTTLSYAFAVIGEGIFMMIAISTMINVTRQQRNAAVMEAIMLRDEISLSKNQRDDEKKRPGINSEESRLVPAEKGFLNRATQSALDNIQQGRFGAKELASALGVTEKTLGRRLKKSQGLAPGAFIRSIRLSYARDLILLRQYETVAQIAGASGFASVSHFAKLYRQEFKEAPSEAFKSLPVIS